PFQQAQIAPFRIGADEDGAQGEPTAQRFGQQMLALNADGLRALAAAPGKSGAQLAHPGILATLYNADEARAIRSRRHGWILSRLHCGCGLRVAGLECCQSLACLRRIIGTSHRLMEIDRIQFGSSPGLGFVDSSCGYETYLERERP